MDVYSVTPVLQRNSEELRDRINSSRYIDEKGEDFPTTLEGQVDVAVEQILGGSVMDLRSGFRQKERESASNRKDHDSDSDSDSEISDRIRHLSEENTTWFRGCGLKFTLDTSIFITQVLFGTVITVFCIIKLITTDDCSVMSTYAPLLSAVGMYFITQMGGMGRKRKKK